MADDKLNLELGVEVTSQGTDKLTDLEKTAQRIRDSLDRLTKSAAHLKNNINSIGKGGSSESKAAKEALDLDKDRMRVLKMRMGYAARELRQQQADELRGIKEAERAQAQADRRALASARELTRARDRGARQIGRGLSQAGGGARRIAGVAAVETAAGAYAAQRTVDSLTRSALTIDDAIVQAQIHVFGEQDASTSRKSAEDLRKRLMPIASKLGTKTADLMGAYVEAAQAGISDDLLSTAVEQGTKYAKMNKLNVPDVLEQSGYAIQGLKSFGKVTEDTLKSYFDETSYIIATTSANRQELLAATRTGMAAGASVGMSRQETLAVLGSIVGVGGEGGQASRMLSTQGSRVANWRNKGRDIIQKHHRTAEDRQFLDAVQVLGYRDSDAMADAFSRDFFGSLVNAQDKIKGISDPLKRKSITAQLFGKEFGALLDSVIMGGQLKEYRDKLNNASGFLNHNWTKFTGNLGFLLDKIGVVFGNITETMGLALKPLWQEVSDWVDRFKGFDRAGEAVTNFTNGLLAGFGASSITDLLNKIFGDPAKFTMDMRSIFLAGKGFAEGIGAVASGIKSLFSAFTGGNTDAQAMGKLAGEIVALSAALTIAAPALIVLSSLTGIIRGLAAAAGGAAALAGGSAAIAGGSAAAGAAGGAAAGVAGGAAAGGLAAGAARLTGVGTIAALAYAAKQASAYGAGKLDDMLGRDKDSALSASGAQRFAFKPFGALGYAYDWLMGGGQKGPTPGQEKGWQDVGPSKRLEEMRKSLDKNTEAVRKNTQATADDARKAAETKAAEQQREEQRRLSEQLVAIRHPAMTGSVGGGSTTYDDLRARGFNPISPNTVPNGSGGRMPRASGGGSSSPAPEGASDPIPGTLNPRLAGSRKSLMDELDRDPALRRDVIKTASMENRGSAFKMQTVLESMVNRAKMNGYTSLRHAIHSGFYGPVNRGGLRGALSDKDRRDGEAALAQVKAGSNAIGYRTDQGMLTDPGARRYMREADHSGHKVIGGENFFLMGQKGRAWARQQEALDARQGSGAVAGAQQSVERTRSLADGINKPPASLSREKPDLSGLDVAPGKAPIRDMFGNDLGGSAPIRGGGSNDMTRGVPLRQTGGRGGSAGGGPITVHIANVSGHDANEVGRKVGEHVDRAAMNRSMHDVDPGGFA